MSSRIKYVLIISVLLLLALAGTAFAATSAIRSFEMVQQQRTLARMGDVRSIRPWMTIPHIAHIYHVPEDYLDRSLKITDARSSRQSTLYDLAARSHESVDDLIHAVQKAIITYRQQPHGLPHSCPGKQFNSNCERGGVRS